MASPPARKRGKGPHHQAAKARVETVGDMRRQVLARDMGCMALRLDPDAGPCYDAWGQPSDGKLDLEMDYVRLRALGTHHIRVDDHVALCAGHHRGMGPTGGYIWATAHRALLRDYLDSLG